MQLQAKLDSEKLSEVTLDIAEQILKLRHPRVSNNHVITPMEIINFVSDFYNIGVQQIKGDRRSAHIVLPRQILMFILRFDAKLPLEEIGRLLGGRDHTTVMHGSEKIQLLLDTNTKIESDIHFEEKIGDWRCID